MQQPASAALARSSWHCFREIARSESLLALWKGTTPRLARLLFSGAIVFTVYEEVLALLAPLPVPGGG